MCQKPVPTLLRVGCVPEHYSCPIFIAQERKLLETYGIEMQVVICRGGTGEMVKKLESGQIDMAIALTEGLIAHLAPIIAHKNALPFKLVGTYTRNPLTWSIAVHPSVKNQSFSCGNSNEESPAEWNFLKNSKVGVSRVGSGSYIIPFVMANKMGWLDEPSDKQPFDFHVLKNIDGLVEGVNNHSIDAFLWERFTTKPYYDRGELHHLSNVTPPWPAFLIAASSEFLAKHKSHVSTVLEVLTDTTAEFAEIQGQTLDSVAYIKSKFQYEEKDIQDWFSSVEFMRPHLNDISGRMISECVEILQKAKVIQIDDLELIPSDFCDLKVVNLTFE